MSYDPKSELGKLLLAVVMEVGTIAPKAFEKIDVEKAIKQADEIDTPKYGGQIPQPKG